MAAIVYQKDKRSGLTYAYESVSYWDKEKKQSRAKRKLIGRLDEAIGEIVPTDGRNRKDKKDSTSKPGPVTAKKVARSFYGATYLLDAIGEKLGITKDLKDCFPDRYKQILSIAYYLVLEDHTPLYRFEKWCSLHKHPWGENIPSQRSSELFASITDEERHRFFGLQGQRRVEKEYWAYDITSISSYSEGLIQVQYGKNKEDDKLPQINLALVCGETSNLPFYCRKLAGNIPDSKTVKHLLADLEELGLKKVKLVMDRGFYSEDNINALLKDHVKFLISGKMSLNFMRNNLKDIYPGFRSFEHYNDTYELYHHTVSTQWQYRQERPYKKDTIKANRRVYIHYYYNIDKAAEEEKAFDRKLMKLKQELEAGTRNPENESQYKKYFGFFCLLTNQAMDAITALEIYKNKDLMEKAFGNLKERLNLRRTLVSSEQSLDGKLFVEFIALIYLSYIKKQMQDAKLFKKYTFQSALDKLDVIECFEVPGKKLRVGEILEKQKDIYQALGVAPPVSL